MAGHHHEKTSRCQDRLKCATDEPAVEKATTNRSAPALQLNSLALASSGAGES
jgi:hypothetical protein